MTLPTLLLADSYHFGLGISEAPNQTQAGILCWTPRATNVRKLSARRFQLCRLLNLLHVFFFSSNVNVILSCNQLSRKIIPSIPLFANA